MDRGLDWYKRDPRSMIDAKRAANDSNGMTMAQAAVYDLVTDLIYEGAGETPNNPKYFASHFSDMSTRAARLSVEFLLGIGKLETNEKGFLSNSRAKVEAKARQTLSETRANAGQKGGKKTASNIKKRNEINETGQANAVSKTAPEKRESKSKISPSDSCAKSDAPQFTLFRDDDRKQEVDLFEEFWQAYPHRGGVKRGKKEAKQKWDAARKRKIPQKTMVDGALAFRQDRKAIEGFAPDPSRWITRELWNDEIEPMMKGQDNGNGTINGQAFHGGGMARDEKAREIADRAARITASLEAERGDRGDA